MKKTLLILAIATVFGSCGNAEIAKLNGTKDSLSNVVMMKDSIINEAFLDISDIATSLNEISAREKLVSQDASSKDITKTTKQQISDNIAAISGLLEQNREAIARLEKSAKRLSAANVEIGSLKKLVASLQKQLAAKDAELADLKHQIENLHGQILTLNTSVAGLKDDKTKLEGTVSEQGAKISEQTTQLNTVHYIVGSEKDLMSQKIIAKKGVIGRTEVVGSNTSLDNYTQSDLRQLDRIPVGKKKISIVTSHPEGSYMLVEGSGKVVEEIVITDKNKFWSNSKILIVSYK